MGRSLESFFPFVVVQLTDSLRQEQKKDSEAEKDTNKAFRHNTVRLFLMIGLPLRVSLSVPPTQQQLFRNKSQME